MKFLTNAPRRKKTRFKKGSLAAKRWMDSIRPTRKGGVSTMAKKKKYTRKPKIKTVTKRVSQITKPPTRYRYRRNPSGFRPKQFVNQLMDGLIGGGQVVIGKALARTVPQTFGIATGEPQGLAVQGIVAVLVGWVGHTFLGANAGKMMMAGALSAPMESIIKQLNIPMVSSALGEEVVEIDGMGLYPSVPSLPLAGYPSSYPEAYGENEALEYQQ